MAFIRTSRGCPFNCIFCMIGGQKNQLVGYGHQWRAYSAKRALDEIKWLVTKLGVKEIVLFDPEFTIDKERVIDICRGIINEKLDVIWTCQARVDKVNQEMLAWMKKAGCYGISYGLETITPNVLKIIKRGVNKEVAESTIKNTINAGIQCGINFMVGLPGETPQTFKENIKFAKYLARKYGVRPQCIIATPYPGTVFRDIVESNKWLIGDIDQLEQTTPSISYPNFTAEQIEKLHKQFYKEVVLDPIRLIKRIFRIRHLNEFRNALIYAKSFATNIFGKMRYVR